MKKLLFTLSFFPAILQAQIISTVAGNGTAGYSGNGGPATAAQLDRPSALAFDKDGNMYICDATNHILMVNTAGIITTIAGNGSAIYSGDNAPATDAGMTPTSIATDSSGNIYITETTRIRKINAAGIITSIAGDGTYGYNGDGIPATSAKLKEPYLGFIDGTGAVYFSDCFNHRIRMIDAVGIISTIVGSGYNGTMGDGGPAAICSLNTPIFLSRDTAGALYIPDRGARRIRKVDAGGTITAFAGTGAGGVGGDGSPATATANGQCSNAVCDDSGNVYISTGSAHRIRKVNGTGIITTIAGSATSGFAGDGGPATAALFDNAGFVTIYHGDLYIADTYNNRIRKITFTTPVPNSADIPSKKPVSTYSPIPLPTILSFNHSMPYPASKL